ncbi:hypothetical protein CU102_23930 [Phyllobacterium brassicacearum]|uniref:HTH marR-type domain-containing protein n=1 Tax=Phyllobacterium brassicacearum TaxID=314235 RepID=A0A2P7BA34_9HYPH|nr:hypothetical protein CU102_23930 [Phyllobacterium brassicacearum]TDQ18165.1 hypothetical protein DEV91_12528 [Phyllobacterium brassicacearum]
MTRIATKQKLMVLRRIPSHNEGTGISIADLGVVLRASESATRHVLTCLCDKGLVRTDTEELSDKSRVCFRTGAGDHILMKQSSTSMRFCHGLAA